MTGSLDSGHEYAQLAQNDLRTGAKTSIRQDDAVEAATFIAGFVVGKRSGGSGGDEGVSNILPTLALKSKSLLHLVAFARISQRRTGRGAVS